jgi:hypothetical protein
MEIPIAIITLYLLELFAGGKQKINSGAPTPVLLQVKVDSLPLFASPYILLLLTLSCLHVSLCNGSSHLVKDGEWHSPRFCNTFG